MKPIFVALLVLLQFCIAVPEPQPQDKDQKGPPKKVVKPEWTISPGCKSKHGEKTYQSIVNAIGEGIETAEKAIPVLDAFLKNINDKKYAHLKKITKAFFDGTKDDNVLKKRLGIVSVTLNKIVGFPKMPSMVTMKGQKKQVEVDPLSSEWVGKDHNQYAGFFCDTSHLKKDTNSPGVVFNAAWDRIFQGVKYVDRLARVCYLNAAEAAQAEADVKSGKKKKADRPIKANCKTSDVQDESTNPPEVSEQQGQSMISICDWAIEDAASQWNWRSFDELVDYVQADEFKKSANGVPAVWAFEHSFAKTILHELTHTNQGGRLGDVPDKNICYGWLGCQLAKRSDNADTVALLAMLFRLHDKGFYWDEKGDMIAIPK